MARLRTLKPGFFTNDILAEIQPLGRLLFQGLWCLADREGRLEDRPRRIKAEVLPYDDADVDAILDALAARGFIIRYEIAGAQYIQVVNFGKHQTPHIKENASTIPAPCKSGASTMQGTASAPPVVGSSSGEWELGSGIGEPDQTPSDLPAVAGGGASAPGGGGGEPSPAMKTDGLPETRPPLTLVPQTATPKPPQPVPRKAAEASELAAFIPLARQIAEAAKLTTYDALALARTVRKHQAHEPDILALEAGKAAEWIADPKRNTKRRPMSVSFLDNWLGKVGDGPQVRGNNRYADTRGRAGEERADATPTPDDEIRAAERNRANFASVMASRAAEERRLESIRASAAQATPTASVQRLQ